MRAAMVSLLAFGGVLAWIGAGRGQGGSYSLVLWPTSLVMMMLAMVVARRRVLEQNNLSETARFMARPIVLAVVAAMGAMLGVALVWPQIAWVCVGVVMVAIAVLLLLRARAPRSPDGES